VYQSKFDKTGFSATLQMKKYIYNVTQPLLRINLDTFA